MQARDRRAAILQSGTYNGIDFVEIVEPQQTTLNVHFLNGVALQVTPLSGQPTITGGETIPTVAVLPIAAADWGFDDGHVVLTLHVLAPGDFSIYTLTIPSPRLDPFFDHVSFSFKANCPSDLDCRTVSPPCPPATGDIPPIDYLAKDFLSFRQALLDFSTLLYPQWQERSEADFGVMFLEALSAIADELSYTQDRVAAEATLVTATQRRSVVRHARLVDYEPVPPQQTLMPVAATVALRFDVAAGVGAIPHGLAATAPAADGSPITFEIGTGLRDVFLDPTTGALLDTPSTSPASPLWNGGLIQPYWFDDSERCLKAGTTQMHVLGRGFAFQPGQSLLIETLAESSADPPIRQIVQLLDSGDPGGPWAREECDELFPRSVDPSGPPWMTCAISPPAATAPTAVTRVAWRSADALAQDRDLTRTTLSGNIVPATQGRTVHESFLIGAPAEGDTTPGTIERAGPRPLLAQGVSGSPPPIQLYTLANTPVAWLPQLALDPSGLPLPEILLLQQNAAMWPTPWNWFSRLLDAGQFDLAYMLESARYVPLGRNSDGTIQSDYDSDDGDTIRFGDGVFGVNPDRDTRFAVTYRYGAGALGNVAADAITQLDPAAIATGRYLSVTNPLAATGGADPQTLQSIQRLAPQFFRAQQLRAVIADDYSAAAETLPWVLRAGAIFRWTGSWLTVLTTPDPRGRQQITIDQRTQLIELLNRRRMAGYESYVPDPDYVSLDLVVDVCAQPNAFRGDVEAGIIGALSAGGPPGGPPGFFAPDNFTFGQPLERSVLETTIQAVSGLAGVTCILFRVRGRFAGFTEMGDTVPVGANQIIRCDNDPSVPEHGAFAVTVDGGR
jgi:hypothetical protein